MTYLIEVELTHPLLNGAIRQVSIPSDLDWENLPLEEKLEKVYWAGQNEVENQPLPSISMGDIIRFEGRRYRVDFVGFTEL